MTKKKVVVKKKDRYFLPEDMLVKWHNGMIMTIKEAYYTAMWERGIEVERPEHEWSWNTKPKEVYAYKGLDI